MTRRWGEGVVTTETTMKTEKSFRTSSIDDGGSSADGDDSRTSVAKSAASDAIIGSSSTFQRSKDEVRAPSKHLKYEPTDHWWLPPLSAWFQETNREIFAFFFLYNCLIILLARYTSLCGDSFEGSFCSETWVLGNDKALAGLSVGMFFLLAFRANQAYDRFWEGRKMWGRLREVCRDFARLVCFHVECETSTDREDRLRAIGFLISFAVSLKLHLRGERNIVQDLTEGKVAQYVHLELGDIANLQQARHMPLFCQDQLSYYLSKQKSAGKLSDYQLGVINTASLAVMSDTMGSCERIRNTPIPLSYVLHMRFFLILWLLFYPLHTVALYGWWTFLFATCISFAVLGIEAMSCEIENPFGYDRNDLNLDEICLGLANDVYDILQRSEHKDSQQIFERNHQQQCLTMDDDEQDGKEDIEAGDWAGTVQSKKCRT